MLNGIANGHGVEALLDAGVRLIERGKPIIPLLGKKPCDDRGLPADGWQILPITAERLERGLSASKEPAIGIIMGPRSGIIDIETDSDDEVEAVNQLFRGCERPIAPAYKSVRGRHDWFAFDARLRPIGKATFEYIAPDKKSVKIRLGVDGKGSQSVIPPSPGREWLPGLSLDDVDPPPLPEIVIERLLKAAELKQAKTSAPTMAAGVHPAILSAIERCTANMADGLDGSKRLFAACCRGVELNGTDAEIIATVRSYEEKRPFPRAWTDAEIVQRIRDAEQTVERGSEVVISNYKEVEVEAESLLSDGSDRDGKETETIIVPKSMGEIIDDINRLTGGWPRRVDNMLFVDDPKHGLGYFDRRGTASMFGWLHRAAKVKWVKGGSYVAQSELFAEIERTAERYTALEVLPHHPPIDGIYYRGKQPPLGDGKHLRWLLDRFRPETTVDRDLIQAALMTLFWGGAPGRRPAFVITSDDGRGTGKTTVAEMAGRICGGVIDVSGGEDFQAVKTRFLTPVARTIRVALLDNVKSMRLSNAELESVITSPIISGRQLFVGEGQRPNLLTWFVTLNGVSMATDMAQRSVIIKVVKGENKGAWHEETTSYIDAHREQIIGDILAALQAEPFELESYSRWATWEKDVLSRLPEPADAQKLILERQGEANCELDEAEIIEQHFAEQLALYGYCPSTAQIRIPVATAAYWFGKAIGEPIRTAAASKRIHQMANEQQLKRLAPDKSRAHGRGFLWTGPSADVFGGSIDNSLPERLADYLNRHQ